VRVEKRDGWWGVRGRKTFSIVFRPSQCKGKDEYLKVNGGGEEILKSGGKNSNKLKKKFPRK